jgi:hypothetical protein
LQEDEQPKEGIVYAAVDGDAATAPLQPQPELAAAVVDGYVAPPPPQAPPVMSERAGVELIHVLRLACATGRAPCVVVALSAVQRLLAQGYLHGEVASLMLDGEGRIAGDAGMHARGLSTHPAALPLPAQVLHLVCACEDHCHEEEVEVRAVATGGAMHLL